MNALGLFVAALAAWGQDPAPVPLSSNVRGSRFPAIDRDLRVTFRLKAPEARSVEVKCRGSLWGGKPWALAKDKDGLWSGTSEPVEPGFYYYELVVDGVGVNDPGSQTYFGWGRETSEPVEPGFYYYELVVDGVGVNDPGSQTYFGWGRETSGLEIPDRALDFSDVKPVPHGEIRIRTYFSKTTETTRRVLVYTPPAYDREPAKRYPVLYLQHGSGENERSWTGQGRANAILDNLIAEKKAEEMIVVMEQGYAVKAGSVPGANARGNEGFEDLVVNDLVPMIDCVYRTIAKREARAIAGLSMGGGQAVRIGLGHMDLFGSVGSLSGGAGAPPGGAAGASRPEGIARAISDPAEFNAKMQLFWIGCGQQDGGYGRAKEAHEALEKAGVKHAWFEVPGAHEWQVWRKSLHDLASRLFKSP